MTPERLAELREAHFRNGGGVVDDLLNHIDALTTSLAAANAGRVEAEKVRDENLARWDEAFKAAVAHQERANAAEQKLATVRRDALEEAAKVVEHSVPYYEGSVPVRLIKTPTPEIHGRLYANLVRGMADDEGTVAALTQPTEPT